MFHIVNTHTKCVVADEEASSYSGRISKEHSDLGPEVPVHEIMSASFKRCVKFLLIDGRQRSLSELSASSRAIICCAAIISSSKVGKVVIRSVTKSR